MGILLSPLTVVTCKKPSMSVLPSCFSAFADNMTTGRPLTPSTSVLPLSHKPVSAILRPSTLIFAIVSVEAFDECFCATHARI